MVHLPLLHRSRGSATSLASDGAAGGGAGSGMSPPMSDDDGATTCKGPAASYLGKLWHWGGESFSRGSGGLFSRGSQVVLLLMWHTLLALRTHDRIYMYIDHDDAHWTSKNELMPTLCMFPQTGMWRSPSLADDDEDMVTSGAQRGVVDVKVDGASRDGGVWVNYRTHAALPGTYDEHAHAEVCPALCLTHQGDRLQPHCWPQHNMAKPIASRTPWCCPSLWCWTAQPEADHEVHMGSKKSGMEAAAAAAIEAATVQQQVWRLVLLFADDESLRHGHNVCCLLL
jgi:hypothetical protein